jgi:hypothetical protein
VDGQTASIAAEATSAKTVLSKENQQRIGYFNLVLGAPSQISTRRHQEYGLVDYIRYRHYDCLEQQDQQQVNKTK